MALFQLVPAKPTCARDELLWITAPFMTSCWRNTHYTHREGVGVNARTILSDHIKKAMSEENYSNNSSDKEHGYYTKFDLENCDIYRSDSGSNGSDSSD